MNTLTMVYQSGEKRVLHPTKEFFIPVPVDVFDKAAGHAKRKILTASDKAMQLAESLGNRLYKATLMRGDFVQMEKTIHANEPAPVLVQKQGVKMKKVDESKVKKQLKNLHKHDVLKTYAHATY